jgi:hypothetical protein
VSVISVNGEVVCADQSWRCEFGGNVMHVFCVLCPNVFYGALQLVD